MQFISWQAMAAAVLILSTIWLAPSIQLSFLYGCVAVIAPNLVIALGMRRAGIMASIFYSMFRWMLVSVSMAVVFVVTEPVAMAYLVGVFFGIATIVLVPMAVELWSERSVPNATVVKD